MHKQKGYNVNKKILRIFISEPDLSTPFLEPKI